MSEVSIPTTIDGALHDTHEAQQRLHETQTEVGKLATHMYEISADPTGSEPSDYLSEEEAQICKDVVSYANLHKWPGAQEFTLGETRWGRNAWRDPGRVHKAPLTKKLFIPEIWKGKGYVFGELGIYPSQRVALCHDGKLRSLRGIELKSSKGVGWGRLPDKDKLESVIADAKYPRLGATPIVIDGKDKLKKSNPNEIIENSLDKVFVNLMTKDNGH